LVTLADGDDLADPGASIRTFNQLFSILIHRVANFRFLILFRREEGLNIFVKSFVNFRILKIFLLAH
jgi:hypothetical protein